MELVLHQTVRRALAAVSSRPSGSYLFYGPPGVGKTTAAMELARALNCRGDTNGPCSSCAQFAAGSFPDLIIIKRADRPSITIEQIRRLVASLAVQPYYRTGTRTVIISGAEHLTTDAANALLKLLEEPPPRTTFLLTAVAAETMLPTVRSRCTAVHFPLPPHDQTVALVQAHSQLDHEAATRLVEAAGGAPGTALTFAANPEAAASRLQLAALADAAASRPSRFERLRLAATVAANPDDAAWFAKLLHHRLVNALRHPDSPTTATPGDLATLEHFRQQLAAKVTPKVALERLMLELS